MRVYENIQLSLLAYFTAFMAIYALQAFVTQK